MKRRAIVSLCVILVAAVSASFAFSQEAVALEVLQFPERETTRVVMLPTYRIAPAEMEARIRFDSGQTRIEASYKKLKPAVLFAGDVTCYVLWAIGRDGNAENLGELWARPEKDSDTVQFSTGQKVFALLVTAEPYYLVTQPSPLVIFQSAQREKTPLRSTPLTFTAFAEAPQAGLQSLTNVRYDGKTPLDLLQAQKVYEIAGRLGADEHAANIYQEATVALQQATIASARGASKGGQEFARRSVAASNDAIRITMRTMEALELEKRIAQRQAEMESLEKRAAGAEARAQQFESTIQSLEREQADSQAALNQSKQELEQISRERRELEAAMTSLQAQQKELQSSLKNLEQDRGRLENRLEGALSQIADTRQSAEGFIINLPDILFDVNQSTLKPQAELVIAKLAGVALIMQDLSFQIEGHTDSTGSASHNLDLSRRRAESVFDFLAANGITSSRMTAVGYGMERPIADNSTAEGRSKNRRVEIIVKEASGN